MNMLDGAPGRVVPSAGVVISRVGIRLEAIVLGGGAEGDLEIPVRLISHELVGGQVIVRLATPAWDLGAVIDRDDGGGFAVADRVSFPVRKLHFCGEDGQAFRHGLVGAIARAEGAPRPGAGQAAGVSP